MTSDKQKSNKQMQSMLEQLKGLFEVAEDQQLAEKLGVSKHAVANWRRRGNLPDKVQIDLMKRFPAQFFLALWGDAENRARFEENTYAVALYILDKEPPPQWQNGTEAEDLILRGIAFGSLVASIRRYIDAHIPKDMPGDKIVEQCISAFNKGTLPGSHRAVREWMERRPPD